jgi:hypothetical protein
MDLIILVLVLAAVGFAVWAITTHVPMPPAWAAILQLFAALCILLYLLNRFRVLPPNLLP